MKVKVKGVTTTPITGEYIRLDSLLKFMQLAETGGDAKLMIQEGAVAVNGEICTQRGRKLRPGDIIRTERGTVAIKECGEGP